MDQSLPRKSLDELLALMAEAEAQGRVGTACKTRPIDARPARPGEVVVTVIKDEGEETRSTPAAAGDWVVRNRCPETGNEMYLVTADNFDKKYKPTGVAPDAEGWREFQPEGEDMRFVWLREVEGSFSFEAPWGETMVAHPGDALVQDPRQERDLYRVAKAAFACTYEIVHDPRPAATA